jgi:hypothetical protein
VPGHVRPRLDVLVANGAFPADRADVEQVLDQVIGRIKRGPIKARRFLSGFFLGEEGLQTRTPQLLAFRPGPGL